MQYQFSASFLAKIVRLAKEIAFHQRGERKLQDIDSLEEKFEKECKELKESDHPEEELPDVVYYGLCLAAHTSLHSDQEFSGHRVGMALEGPSS